MPLTYKPTYLNSMEQLGSFMKAYRISALKNPGFKASVNTTIGDNIFTSNCNVVVSHPGKISIKDLTGLSKLCQFSAAEEHYEFSADTGLKIKGIMIIDSISVDFFMIILPHQLSGRSPFCELDNKILECLSHGKLYTEIAGELDVSFLDIAARVKQIFSRIDPAIVEEELLN